jgi:putative lipoic acid-binding regulatory protein
MDAPFGDRRLELEFPCEWTYTVIGSDAERLHAALSAAAGERTHRVTLSRKSSQGRYVSLELVATVESDEERLRIYAELHAHEAVRMIF